MKHVLIVSLIAVSAFASESVKSASPSTPRAATVHPVTATLTLPYAELLPGVSFDATVTFSNKASQRLAIGTRAHLVCESSDPPIVGTEERNVGDFGYGGDAYFEVEKGESVHRALTWYLFPQPWDSISTIAPPGEYRIALIIEGSGGQSFGDDAADAAYDAGMIRTTEVIVKRIQPEGENAKVWEMLQQFASGKWPAIGFVSLPGGHDLAMRIVREYPDSDYYPYALLFSKRGFDITDVPALLDAAERFPRSPAVPYLLKRAGDQQLSMADRMWAAGKADEALGMYAKAEAVLSRAAATRGSIRDEAAIGLAGARAGRERKVRPKE